MRSVIKIVFLFVLFAISIRANAHRQAITSTDHLHSTALCSSSAPDHESGILNAAFDLRGPAPLHVRMAPEFMHVPAASKKNNRVFTISLPSEAGLVDFKTPPVPLHILFQVFLA